MSEQDDFLNGLREEPRPEFAAALQERLQAIEEAQAEAALRPRWTRRVPAFAGLGLAAMLAAAFTLEPVRAAARDFLDLFRVKRFAAVPFDPARLQKLANGGIDFKSLVGDQVQVLVAPVKPEPVDSPAAGAVAAGIPLAEPAWLPNRYSLADAAVARPGSYRIQLDASKLQELANVAGAEEIEVPSYWNGATIHVDLPPNLILRYVYSRDDGTQPRESSIVLVQSESPKIELPEGVELATLGRLALRVAGMSADEALRFSQTIDWRTTLLVPVPVQGGTYREVEVNGATGLLVTHTVPQQQATGDGKPRRERRMSLLLWSTGEKAYALSGPGERADLLAMAQTIR